ncbi:hypothetical protein BKA70DRAFT_1216492 [Coprinopsis sp. MPI-PUGE-AT-0042]|nr:hypothetical protein BKA70DRAFT_1216492 [Coprinopsis sp. MPI-PUGE-AT-0042]
MFRTPVAFLAHSVHPHGQPELVRAVDPSSQPVALPESTTVGLMSWGGELDNNICVPIPTEYLEDPQDLLWGCGQHWIADNGERCSQSSWSLQNPGGRSADDERMHGSRE